MDKDQTKFALRVIRYQNSKMINICDIDLVGKIIKEGDLTINLSESFFLEEVIDKQIAKELLITCSMSNLVGKEIVDLAIQLKLAKKVSIRFINGIPFLMIFKFQQSY